MNRRQQVVIEYLQEELRVLQEQLGKRPRFTDDQRRRLTVKGKSVGRKGMTWKEFLRTHWDVIAATDFLTAEVWTPAGLVRYHVLFVIRLATREIKIAGIVPEPEGHWMNQMARNLTDAADGFLRGYRYLIQDRSSLFTEQFRETLRSAGVESLKLPARSPNLNAHAERFVRTIKGSKKFHQTLLVRHMDDTIVRNCWPKAF